MNLLRKLKNRGVSLLECVVTLTIITVVSITAISIVRSSVKLSSRLSFQGEARSICESALECFKYSDYPVEFSQTIGRIRPFRDEAVFGIDESDPDSFITPSFDADPIGDGEHGTHRYHYETPIFTVVVFANFSPSDGSRPWFEAYAFDVERTEIVFSFEKFVKSAPKPEHPTALLPESRRKGGDVC